MLAWVKILGKTLEAGFSSSFMKFEEPIEEEKQLPNAWLNTRYMPRFSGSILIALPAAILYFYDYFRRCSVGVFKGITC